MVNTFTILKLSTHYEINGDRTRMNLVMLWQCSSGILCFGASTPSFLPSPLLNLKLSKPHFLGNSPPVYWFFFPSNAPLKLRSCHPPPPFFWKFGRFNHPAEMGERGGVHTMSGHTYKYKFIAFNRLLSPKKAIANNNFFGISDIGDRPSEYSNYIILNFDPRNRRSNYALRRNM